MPAPSQDSRTSSPGILDVILKMAKDYVDLAGDGKVQLQECLLETFDGGTKITIEARPKARGNHFVKGFESLNKGANNSLLRPRGHQVCQLVAVLGQLPGIISIKVSMLRLRLNGFPGVETLELPSAARSSFRIS